MSDTWWNQTKRWFWPARTRFAWYGL